ncbi:MAG: TspO/MBR family protein [Rhizobiaceae bacterium]|nr:TspO/MBR family protein [Rhizobiaceae bacterium]
MDWALLFFVFLNVVAAMSGGFFAPGKWYEELRKPSWQPPNWAFPTVWSVLYLLNAIAGWMVWKVAGIEGIGFLALSVYVVSLVFNAAWSAIFFGMKRMRLALLEAGLLWASVALQIYLFLQIDSAAGLILFPYLAWVSIAFWLNRTMLRLNPEFA